MVLAALVGKFRLQKELSPRYQTCAVGSGHTFADSGFVVVPALVGRVNAAKTSAQSQFRERRGAVFLPRSAVEKFGKDQRWLA